MSLGRILFCMMCLGSLMEPWVRVAAAKSQTPDDDSDIIGYRELRASGIGTLDILERLREHYGADTNPIRAAHSVRSVFGDVHDLLRGALVAVEKVRQTGDQALFLEANRKLVETTNEAEKMLKVMKDENRRLDKEMPAPPPGNEHYWDEDAGEIRSRPKKPHKK